MRIVILSPKTSGSGGVERFSHYAAEAARQAGFSARIMGAEDLGLGMHTCISIARCVGLQQPMLGYALGKKALAEGFDICITNGLLGWNIRGKTINVEHGTFARAAERIDRGRNYFKYVIKRYVWGWFEGLAARRAAQCVAVSEETKESVARYYGASAIVIGNAVDTDRFTPGDRSAARKKWGIADQEKIVLFVGRFEYAKGVDIIAAMENLLRVEGIRFVIAEHYSQDDLVSWYQAADIFILPSLHEGSSYALLEAMSSGLPFVASPVGLVSEFVRQGMFSECIVHKHTAEAYVARIRLLLALDAEQRHALTTAERDYIVKAHSLSAFSEAYVHLFKQLS